MLVQLANVGQGRVRGEVTGQRECMWFYAYPNWDTLTISFTHIYIPARIVYAQHL